MAGRRDAKYASSANECPSWVSRLHLEDASLCERNPSDEQKEVRRRKGKALRQMWGRVAFHVIRREGRGWHLVRSSDSVMYSQTSSGDFEWWHKAYSQRKRGKL